MKKYHLTSGQVHQSTIKTFSKQMKELCSSTNDYVTAVESIFDIINVFGFGHQKMICYCGFRRKSEGSISEIHNPIYFSSVV